MHRGRVFNGVQPEIPAGSRTGFERLSATQQGATPGIQYRTEKNEKKRKHDAFYTEKLKVDLSFPRQYRTDFKYSRTSNMVGIVIYNW